MNQQPGSPLDGEGQVFNMGIAKLYAMRELFTADNKASITDQEMKRPKILRSIEAELSPYLKPEERKKCEELREVIDGLKSQLLSAPRRSKGFAAATEEFDTGCFDYRCYLQDMLHKHGFEMPDKKDPRHAMRGGSY